jgi:transposase
LTALEQVVARSQVFAATTRVSEGFKPNWTRSYARRLAVTDAAAIVGSVAMAQLVRFGADSATLRSGVAVYSYTAVSALLILAWFGALILSHSREPRVLEEDSELSIHQAVQRISSRVGVNADTLRGRCKQADIDAGKRPGTTTGDAQKIKEPEAEVRELKRPNGILLAASSFFAREHDPRLPW